ncbi:nucleotide sugar dehydrogenase [Halorussus marinus]|uniref:nucleotide sugar dehydrogenase n=1 Tax=Halorussus marinus TaxID=2505976 RepID=UPI0014306FB1|nr:nucleotide sugar dehydrogenase [Halorussus marinus]
MIERASVIGLGKLGVCLAATLSNNGIDVTGVDIDEQVVNQVNAGEAPVTEPKLQAYINDANAELTATTPTERSITDTDITFIVVNTPSTEAGRYSLKYVEEVCELVGRALGRKDEFHTVAVTSTVFPGSTDGEIRDWLEEYSGKTAGEDFGLCYSPEFIAIGDVIDGLENPDNFLIGELNERAGDVVEAIYNEINEDVPVARMAATEAEIAKMAINSYVTMKISFVNTLAEICDGVGGNVDNVTEYLALDSRISGSYLTSGARFGGPCFPRDNVAFARLAEDAGTRAPLAESTDAVNDQHTKWIADRVRETTSEGDSVGILGMTYKPGTYLVTESQGIELVAELADDFETKYYDPMGNRQAESATDDAEPVLGMADLLRGTDTVVVATPWEEFEEATAFTDCEVTLVDPWRLFESEELPRSVEYVPIGRESLDRTTELEDPVPPETNP